MKQFYISVALIVIALNNLTAQLTDPAEIWDSIKNNAAPIVAPAFAAAYGTPYRQPLSAYGWEDGVQISADGLNLYALYAPADLLSWWAFIGANPDLPVCETIGNTQFIRPYAQTYGMDMNFNFFGCDTGLNIDILYAQRNNIYDEFTTWQLSDIARPGLIEGGPFPLQSAANPSNVDHFVFTGNGDIWMINNTTVNPSGIASAVRLPNPINPATDEYIADNPVMRRFNNSDSLLLVFEKYNPGTERDFLYSISTNNGITWQTPVVMSTITAATGHIEHPQLYSNAEGTWLYYSRDYDIYRMKQSIKNNWDSWVDEELIIAKGNALAIGEPSIAANGDISFLVVYENLEHPDDRFDIDPWYLRKLMPDNITTQNSNCFIQLFPNPATNYVDILSTQGFENATINIFNIQGNLVLNTNYNKGSINIENISPGVYFVQIVMVNGKSITKQLIVK